MANTALRKLEYQLGEDGQIDTTQLLELQANDHASTSGRAPASGRAPPRRRRGDYAAVLIRTGREATPPPNADAGPEYDTVMLLPWIWRAYLIS